MAALKQWNIGNTTVRNPTRIPDALRVLRKTLDDAENTRELQARVWKQLVDADVVDSESRGGGDWGGRKWIHAFVQLGLVRRQSLTSTRDKLLITDVGRALLDGTEPPAELYLRQLLKYHLPSPVEDKQSSYAGFDLHPLRFFLALLWTLNERGEPGLTKDEIGLFVMSKTRNDQLAQTVDEVLDYRRGLAKLKGKVARVHYYERARVELGRRVYDSEIKRLSAQLMIVAKHRAEGRSWQALREELDAVVRTQRGAGTSPSAQLAADLKALIDADDLANARKRLGDHIARRRTGTMKDYADTLVRYSSLTELFSVHGRRIALQTTSKLPVIEVIVAEGFPAFAAATYSDAYWDPKVPALPTEKTEVVRAQVRHLVEAAKSEAQKLGKTFDLSVPSGASRGELVAKRAELETNVITLKVETWAKHLSDEEQLDQIAQTFQDIRKNAVMAGIIYRPAFQEWNWWKVILAFDALAVPADQTRNFPIDAELFPTHNARSGVADMVFTYDEWLLVVEVTLNTTARQWTAEGEPVPRHVAEVVASVGAKKPVIGLFLAPAIDLNTAQTFFTQLRDGYVIKDKLVPLKIIPVPEDDAIGLVDMLRQGKFGTADLRALLEDCVSAAASCTNGIEWLAAIRKIWRTRLVAQVAA